MPTLIRNLFLSFWLLTFCTSAFASHDKESLAEFFFRYGVFALTTDNERVRINEQALKAHEPELDWIWNQLRSRLPLQSALNVSVRYADPFKSQVRELEWSQQQDAASYADVEFMQAYLLRTLDEVRSLFSQGYEPLTLNFDQVQQVQSYAKRTTITGEEIRICGLTKEVEAFLLGQLAEHLETHDLHPHHIFYFGSRVMPRTELVKRNPDLAKTLPLDEKGFKKDRVRVGGLTKVSDLELLLIVSSPNQLSRDDLAHIKKRFKTKLEKVFKEFAVSLQFLVVNDEVRFDDPFRFIKATYQETRNRILTPHQFVQLL